jgi:hypothetical protein
VVLPVFLSVSFLHLWQLHRVTPRTTELNFPLAKLQEL